MNKITLYAFDSPDISITMQLYFNAKNQLIFEGFDIGENVEKITGDSSYEYFYTIEFEEAKKIAAHLGIDISDRDTLLQTIKTQFGGNDAYSRFGEFMQQNAIHFERFVWGGNK